ncbi:ABC transporter ATP-binding protein [Galbitalea sp. SE-J8]|uniref:ABC transporter ATP-binding protein n=1 Tax=Galbitalea sp. SE-J8 TaxID=3054952 RepID=UPI00259C6FC4|nr:ABC transporter ATP-binding protein [Galbitalea sp. SE-J8]
MTAISATAGPPDLACSPGAADSRHRSESDGHLRLEKLSKHFGDNSAVTDLNISIAKGEFVAFLGPSGCGKTTTLRMIAGFVRNDAGAIHLDGRRIDTLPSRRRETAMVFQDYALFPHMSVFENVAFGLRMRKIARAETMRRVGEALELVQLTGTEKKFPKELSGGMRQRVALARAIVVRPSVLLLDEPLSNLDAKLRKSVRDEIRAVHDQVGITTVLVTHDLEEAFSVGDRVVVMRGGRVEQFGTPQQIYSRPANRFVADFVGHTNLLEGSWEPSATGARFVSRAFDVATTEGPDRTTTAVYTIPPSNIRVSTDVARPDSDIVLRGTVISSSFYGASYGITARVGDVSLQVSMVTGAGAAPEAWAGREIWLHWDAADGHCVRA